MFAGQNVGFVSYYFICTRVIVGFTYLKPDAVSSVYSIDTVFGSVTSYLLLLFSVLSEEKSR